MDLGLAGKTAIVTGASRGLGRAAATALAGEGAKLAICARGDQIYAVAKAIRQETGSEVFGFQADLASGDQVAGFVAGAREKLGRIDILVANAGGPPPGSFLDLKPEDWEAAYQVTVMSAVRLCYAVVPLMVIQGQGSIVLCQSYSVKQPVEYLMLSNSLRMAVIGLAKSLANELGGRGIRVNSLNPAWTSTERVEELMRDRASRSGTSLEAEVARITAGIPLGRMGTVEEFGRTVAWLSSPAASFIHGHALFFDGGATQAPL